MITIVAAAVIIGVYLYGVHVYRRRFPGRTFSGWRVSAFIIGMLLLGASLCAWADAAADRSFFAHMVQHMLLMLVAAPLVLLGAPMLLLVATPRASIARRITALAHSFPAQALFAPVTGWVTFVAVLWVAHFSPLYEWALRSPWVHVFEHALFLTCAFLFWSVVIQVGYAPRPVPYAARMLYLFLAIPQGAFLGLAIYSARGVLYPHYVTVPAALADQQNAGALMWIAGGFLMFAAFMMTGAAWAIEERRAGATLLHARVGDLGEF